MVQDKVTSSSPILDPLLVESVDQGLDIGFQVEDAFVQPGDAGLINVVISNLSGCSTQLQEDTVIGKANTASLVESVSEASPISTPVSVLNIQSVEQRQAILEELIPKSPLLTQQQSQALWELLKHHHTAFCLDDDDRGELTSLKWKLIWMATPPEWLHRNACHLQCTKKLLDDSKRCRPLELLCPQTAVGSAS